VEEFASPLSDELFRTIEQRARQLRRRDQEDYEQRKSFLATTSVRQWPGLVTVPAGTASERQKQAFVTEWFATLQILRDIAGTISRDENRPRWLPSDVPMGAQADQFLHAYYYNQVIGDDGRSLYEEKFATNRADPARALVPAFIGS